MPLRRRCLVSQVSRGAFFGTRLKYDDLNVVRRRTASEIGALETSTSRNEEQPEVSDPIAMDSAVDLVAKTGSDGGHSPDVAPRTNHHAEDGASPPPPPPPPPPGPGPDDPQSQKQSRPQTLPPDPTTIEAPPAPAAATAPAESNPYVARSPAANSSSSSKSRAFPLLFCLGCDFWFVKVEH